MARSNGVIGFLARLRRDARGNALAIMAAAMIPLCAFAGSAIDLGRMYVVRTRLQTACDAGVLAGRKFMDSNTQAVGQPLSGTALTQANAYFNNNFGSSWAASSWFVAGSQSFTTTAFSDSNGITQVNGAASTQVPMTLMRMFGAPNRTIAVTCQASFDTPDADVMFVLDTTGSMSCLPSDPTSCGTTSVPYTMADGSTDYYNPEKSGSKLQAVRDAVATFYDTLAANLTPGTNVRYGFVPYTSTVNAGAALTSLGTNYLATQWTYQSRKVTGDYAVSKSGNASNTSDNKTTCQGFTLANTRSAAAYIYPATGKLGTWSNSTCSVQYYNLGPVWTYQPVTYNTSAFVNTLSSGSVTDPSKVTGATTSWQGCIDEQSSGNYNNVSSYNINALPADMNPDLIPASAAASPWAPMWPAVEYARNGQSYSYANGDYGFYNSANDVENGENNATDTTSSGLAQNANFAGTYARYAGYAPCGQPAQRLTPRDPKNSADRAAVVSYMASLRAHGGTYHDTGMIWGLRMISPQGIFGNDTAKWPGHAEPKRVIVFLTDGAMSTSPLSYGMTGIESLDKRVRGTTSGDLDDWHNARFLAECQKAQQKNIQVWVVAVGQSLTQPLIDCVGSAHPERAIFVNSSTDLSAKFKDIATAVSMLRVSQ
jgi:Flp pilus assembly protein TadG